MPTWQFILGKALQIAAYAVIILLIYRAYKDTMQDIEQEAKQEAKEEAQRIAEKLYREKIAETQYRVHTALRIVDEQGGKT